jgi:hypothetical protein
VTVLTVQCSPGSAPEALLKIAHRLLEFIREEARKVEPLLMLELQGLVWITCQGEFGRVAAMLPQTVEIIMH